MQKSFEAGKGPRKFPKPAWTSLTCGCSQKVNVMKLQVLFLETGREERPQSGNVQGAWATLPRMRFCFQEGRGLYTWYSQCQPVGSAALRLGRFLLYLLLANI